MAKGNDSYRASVLIVDDESAVRDSLRMILEYEGYRVEEAIGGPQALARMGDRLPDAVLLDVKMPEMDGIEVLRAMRERGYDMPVLMVSGHADVATAVEATRLGAYDFFEKPLQRERVLVSLRNAVESSRLRAENRSLGIEPETLIGAAAAMRKLRETIEKAAPTNATVLITGESGTGKELVARAIHRASARSARTQAKVLRVLQNGEVEPVGAERTVQVDVRVVAATNRNLEDEIAAARFREDLYYRLNVIPVRTPALRERLEDVPLLVDYFVRGYSEANNCRPKEFAPDALGHLRALPWKGNVRELKNLIERLLILSPGEVVTREDVIGATGGARPELSSGVLAVKTLREFRDVSERMFLIHKLEENGWNVTQTAQSIDTPRSNLYKKLEQYDIRREETPREP